MINGTILTLKLSFLDGDISLSPSYGVYISRLIHFTRVCSIVDDFNNSFFLTSKLLIQAYCYHKLREAFLYFCRHSELIVEHNVCLKTLLQ